MDFNPQALEKLLGSRVKEILSNPAEAKKYIIEALGAELKDTRIRLSLAHESQLRGETKPFHKFEGDRVSFAARVNMHIPGVVQDTVVETRGFYGEDGQLFVRVAPGGTNISATVGATIDEVVKAFDKAEPALLVRTPSAEGLSLMKKSITNALGKNPGDFAQLNGGLASMVVSYVRKMAPRWLKGDFSEGPVVKDAESAEPTAEKETEEIPF